MGEKQTKEQQTHRDKEKDSKIGRELTHDASHVEAMLRSGKSQEAKCRKPTQQQHQSCDIVCVVPLSLKFCRMYLLQTYSTLFQEFNMIRINISNNNGYTFFSQFFFFFLKEKKMLHNFLSIQFNSCVQTNNILFSLSYNFGSYSLKTNSCILTNN